MKIIRLDKKAITLSGNAAKFLNGLTSNVLDKPANAFLNLHGRIIATVDQFKISDEVVVIVVASSVVAELLNHVERFARLNKTTIDVLPLFVYFDLDNQLPLEAGDYMIAQKAGRLIITRRDFADTVNADEFTLFRLRHAIPLHTVDYQSNDMILNVHEHEYVSYTKGCFLGQEPVAKVHNRAKPTWQLLVKYAEACTPEEMAKMTSVMKDPDTGRIKGFVFVKNI